MYKVVKTFRAGNRFIDNAKKLASLDGWKVGKPYKRAIMLAMVNCEYTQTFESREEYMKNIQSMQNKFEEGLRSVGFTDEQIGKYSGDTVLPEYKVKSVKVTESFVLCNSKKPNKNNVSTRNGNWTLGEIHKVGIGGAGRTVTFETEISVSDFVNRFKIFNDDFVNGLYQLGITTDEEKAQINVTVNFENLFDWQ